MVRNQGWLVVASLGLGLVSAACKKDDKKTDPNAVPTPGAKMADKAEKADPSTPAGAAAMIGNNPNASDLTLLPVDSEVVLGLNFSQLQKSALWKKFVEPQMMKPETQKKLAEFQAKCGFDPMTAVQSISMGLKGVGGDKPDGVVVVHGTEKAKVMGCMDTMKAEAEKDGSTVTKDGDTVVVKSKDGDTVAFSYVNDTTLLAVVGPTASAATVKAAAAGTSTLKSSATFVEMYSKINTSDSLWILMNGNAKVFEKAAGMGVKPKALFGSINVTDGLAVDMRLRLDTPDQAAQIANMAKSQVAQFKAMTDRLDIANDGADVKLNVVLSTAKLEALVAQFAGMMGGMGGGHP